MIVKLLTGHHLECLSLIGGCTGTFESTLVKIVGNLISRLNYKFLCPATAVELNLTAGIDYIVIELILRKRAARISEILGKSVLYSGLYSVPSLTKHNRIVPWVFLYKNI